MKPKALLSHRATRFVAVGVCNAAISFGVLNLAYYMLHQSKIVSSIIATACALVFSFVFNRGFVFADKATKMRYQLPAFVIVTVSGSFLVLNLIYAASLKLLAGNEQLFTTPVHLLTGITLPESFIDINVSTVIGAVAAAFWNYYGYKWFVFRVSKKHATQVAEEEPDVAF